MSFWFFTRLVSVTVATLLIVAAWQSFPLVSGVLLGRFAEPRPIAPRGDLAASEQSAIAIFESARDSVVFITTEERVIDPWTRNSSAA